MNIDAMYRRSVNKESGACYEALISETSELQKTYHHKNLKKNYFKGTNSFPLTKETQSFEQYILEFVHMLHTFEIS